MSSSEGPPPGMHTILWPTWLLRQGNWYGYRSILNHEMHAPLWVVTIALFFLSFQAIELTCCFANSQHSACNSWYAVYMVYGATGGIGSALAHRLAKQADAKVFLVGRYWREQCLQRTVSRDEKPPRLIAHMSCPFGNKGHSLCLLGTSASRRFSPAVGETGRGGLVSKLNRNSMSWFMSTCFRPELQKFQ